MTGPTWLVWREHRAWFRVWMACSLALTCYLVYWHVRYHATFAELTGPGPNATTGLPPDLGLTAAAVLLTITPALTAVTFGAPLFEREFTSGTARLVRAQSMSDAAWVRAKLLVPGAMVVACVTPCAAALTWDYQVDFAWQQDSRAIGVFDAIGPAAVAICLAGLFLGAAAGLTWPHGAASKFLAVMLVLAFEAAIFGGMPLVPGTGVVALQSIVTVCCVGVCGALASYCLHLLRRCAW
ncbi:MAG TPA: hypothetical protein VFN97_20110 [Actinospica sp.]|nr:hypothetical protein [Actinospica sp.]